MIYGAPAARPAEPSRAPAAMPTGLPLVPMVPNAGTLTPQSPKRRSNTKKDAAEIVALVLLGAVIGYALHEPLNVLLGGL
jgi:hypothetical protein